MKRDYKSMRKGQSTMEYFIILAVVLTAILASGFIGRLRGAFDIYFTRATAEIVTER